VLVEHLEDVFVEYGFYSAIGEIETQHVVCSWGVVFYRQSLQDRVVVQNQFLGIISWRVYPVTLMNPSEAKTIGLSDILSFISASIQSSSGAETCAGFVRQKQSPNPTNLSLFSAKATIAAAVTWCLTNRGIHHLLRASRYGLASL